MGLKNYKNTLLGLLPVGLAWPREKGTNLDNLITAVAEEPNRVAIRVADMLKESYPLTSSELLTDWERITGLPEACTGAPDTLQARREAVDQKLGSIGGQSKQFYIDLAAKIGFEVTITEYSPFKVGKNATGDALAGDDWAYAWQINAPEETIREFKTGRSSVGEPLRYWGNELLECVISRVKPAHTYLLFAYGD